MADKVKLHYTESTDFKPYSEGTHAMRIVDVIDLGLRLREYPGQPPEVKHAIAIVWAGDEKQESGELITVSKEYTNSLHRKSSLRQALEAMRGKSYTEEQAAKASRDENFLARLVNYGCLVTVEHGTSKKSGRTYGVVKALMALPKGMEAPAVTGYKRGSYWDTRKAEYADAVAKFQAKTDEPEYPADFDEPQDTPDDLPF